VFLIKFQDIHNYYAETVTSQKPEVTLQKKGASEQATLNKTGDLPQLIEKLPETLIKQITLTPQKKHNQWEILRTHIMVKTMPEDIKSYYVQAANHLKTGLKLNKNIDILDLTSQEIKDLLKKHPINQADYLIDCLEKADWVKFAKHHPTGDEFKAYQIMALKFLTTHEPVIDSIN